MHSSLPKYSCATSPFPGYCHNRSGGAMKVPVRDRVIISSRIGSDGVELEGGVEFGTTLI